MKIVSYLVRPLLADKINVDTEFPTIGNKLLIIPLNICSSLWLVDENIVRTLLLEEPKMKILKLIAYSCISTEFRITNEHTYSIMWYATSSITGRIWIRLFICWWAWDKGFCRRFNWFKISIEIWTRVIEWPVPSSPLCWIHSLP